MKIPKAKDIFKKSVWVHFYLWRHKGNPVYVGQTVDITKRTYRHIFDQRALGKLISSDSDNCTCEELGSVWDVFKGRWATGIENAFIDAYATHIKYKKGGFNLQYGFVDINEINFASVGGYRLHQVHPNLAKENAQKRVESGQAHEFGKKWGPINGEKYKHLLDINRIENSRKGGRVAVETGQIYTIRTTESCRKGGLIGGPIGGRIGGLISGRKAVESGHIYRMRTKESCSKGGKIQGRRAWDSGQLASITTSEVCSKGGRACCHLRWHVKRNMKNPNCEFCVGDIDVRNSIAA